MECGKSVLNICVTVISEILTGFKCSLKYWPGTLAIELGEIQGRPVYLLRSYVTSLSLTSRVTYAKSITCVINNE